MWEYLERNLKADVIILPLLNLRVNGNWRRHVTYFLPGPLHNQNAMDFITEISFYKNPGCWWKKVGF